MNLEQTIEAMSENQRKLFEAFKEDLATHRFGIAKDFDEVDALTVTRGSDNIADIYGDGRVTTCFVGFRALPAKEKIIVIQIITKYVCYRLEESQ